MNNHNIYIIGAGISGLIVALELEKQGHSPVILEATDSVGGRVKTDIIEGIPLDRGFQVLLDSYPAAQKYLDYESLSLKKFLPGAIMYRDRTRMELGDPLRHPAFGLATIFSEAATFADKLKVYKLSLKLKNKSLDQIFQEPEKSTLTYLRDNGFSERIIEHFFKPFFTGIYLESKLVTSSRMFEFVYKMFAEGRATIPAKGIHAIPEQLKNKLKSTTIKFNSPVKTIEGVDIISKDGERIAADRIIIATAPDVLFPEGKEEVKWRKSTTIYFKVKRSILNRPIIGLISEPRSLVNNFHFLNDVLPISDTPQVLSATVVRDHNLSDETLCRQAGYDLAKHTGLQNMEYFHHVHIPKALPRLNDLKYEPDPEDVRMSEHVFMAGDYLANGSVNAAMLSGALAAKMVHDSIN